MPIDLIGTGLDIAGDVAGDAIGMITQKRREERAMTNQEKLMGIQTANQMKLNEQGQQLQLDTWNKTNYNAQVEQLKKAGLNPALLYGKGGGGGATTGSQGGGSAAGGQAPAPQTPFIGIEAVQFAKLAAETKLLEAQAKKAEADANKTSGVDTRLAETTIGKLISETTNQDLKNEYQEIENGIRRIESSYTDRKLAAEYENTLERTNQLRINNKITKAQADDLILEQKFKALGQALTNDLTRSNIKLKDTERAALNESVQQKWREIEQGDVRLAQGAEGLSQKAMEIEIDKFVEEMKLKYPVVGQVIGHTMKRWYREIQNIDRDVLGLPRLEDEKIK